ncbi:MAG: methyltransferase domain-containing protein [Polyangiaceae bacterium]
MDDVSMLSGQQRKQGLGRDEVKATMDAYSSDYAKQDVAHLQGKYADITTQFYNLVTDFYEIGWGEAFHFAVRRRGEAFKDSIIRHETYLADKLQIGPNKRAIDFGCGVGGPMRVVVKATGAHVTGVNLSAYQVGKARRYNEKAGLSHLTEIIHCDFLNIPVPDATFDAAFAFEATCHAPDKARVYGEAARVTKPGGLFAVYEWCVTPQYDDNNPEHQRVRFGIEKGNALPRLATFDEVKNGMAAAGFEVLEERDRALDSDPFLTWQSSLSEISIRSLARTPAGRALTNALTGALERLNLAPKGTQSVSTFLNAAADSLVAGGDMGIFTPMYFVLARKKG